MSNIQKIGSSAFIYKDGKILLLLRSANEKAFPFFYEMPGGKIEFGESAEEALRREVLEETGLDIKVLNPYSTFFDIINDKHYIDIQFFCELQSGEIKLSEEHDKYFWAKPEDLTDLKISDEMRGAITKGFNLIN